MILLLLSIAFAQDLPGETIFESAKPAVVEVQQEVQKYEVGGELEPSNVPKLLTKTSKVRKSPEKGNLPGYFPRNSRESTIAELVQPKPSKKDYFPGFNVGDILSASISHSVIAFPDEAAPVIAELSGNKFRNIKLIGKSILEKNSKRVFIDFNKLVVGKKVFEIKAKATSETGGPGLIGKYHSREAEYFAGDFISSFVAGYFDGLVPKRTNVFGQQEVDTSVDSAMKKGLASGAMSTAERFKEKLKKVPEFSELQGPFDIQVLVLEN